MGNYHDQIGADARPDLCFNGIYGLSIKRFDSQVLLNPFKEQFDLPATFVVVGDPSGVAPGDVGQKDNILLGLGIDQTNPTHRPRISSLGFGAGQPDDLIALQTAGRINRRGGFAIILQILFGPNYKPSTLAVQVVQTLKIQVSTIHNIDAAGQDRDHVQDLYIVGLAVGNMDKCGDGALQVHKSVQLNSGFTGTKLSPREQGKTQVDGRGIQDLYGFGQLVFAIQGLGMGYQDYGQILIDLPRAMRVGVRKRTQRHVGFDAHMVAARSERGEGGRQIPQAVAKGELSETHTEKLIAARELLGAVITLVAIHYFSKFVCGNNIHKL